MAAGRNLLAGALLVLAAGVTSGTARAQPQLQMVEPSRNTTVTTADHVSLRFSEPLAAKTSSVTVELTAGPERSGVGFGMEHNDLRTKESGVDPADAQSLRVVFAKALTPGLYTIKWRAGSADGKLARGMSSFYVK